MIVGEVVIEGGYVSVWLLEVVVKVCHRQWLSLELGVGDDHTRVGHRR